MSEFKSPMLAAKPKTAADYDKITYPKLASPKLDGVRAVVQDGKVYSRKGLLIPNQHVQRLYGRKALNGVDGELIVGDPTEANVFQATMSGVMSIEGEPAVGLFSFDHPLTGGPFARRLVALEDLVIRTQRAAPGFTLLHHTRISTPDDMLLYEADMLAQGYEGIMLRDPNGEHKHGRSTLREQGLIAVKRFVQAEGVILDSFEQMANTNEATRNELGRVKRSSAKVGKVGKGVLGGVHVRVTACSEAPEMVGTKVDVGTGFNDDQRRVLWTQRAGLIGQTITFKFQAHGSKDAPRIPVFIGFRPEGF